VLSQLAAVPRATIEQDAAFVSYNGAVLTLGVRSPAKLNLIRETLRNADFTTCLPGFRNVDVIVDTSSGQTGREIKRAFDEKRREEAKIAAAESATVKRVLAMFGGEVESVEPSDAIDATAGTTDDEPMDE
jgi:hypothetical protein